MIARSRKTATIFRRSEAKKEDERVMKETLKYSNASTAKKQTNKKDQEVEDILAAMMLTNGRRTFVNGRSVLDYDMAPNPRFQAKNLTSVSPPSCRDAFAR